MVEHGYYVAKFWMPHLPGSETTRLPVSRHAGTALHKKHKITVRRTTAAGRAVGPSNVMRPSTKKIHARLQRAPAVCDSAASNKAGFARCDAQATAGDSSRRPREVG